MTRNDTKSQVAHSPRPILLLVIFEFLTELPLQAEPYQALFTVVKPEYRSLLLRNFEESEWYYQLGHHLSINPYAHTCEISKLRLKP